MIRSPAPGQVDTWKAGNWDREETTDEGRGEWERILTLVLTLVYTQVHAVTGFCCACLTF